jgi:hypothetical protein
MRGARTVSVQLALTLVSCLCVASAAAEQPERLPQTIFFPTPGPTQALTSGGVAVSASSNLRFRWSR